MAVVQYTPCCRGKTSPSYQMLCRFAAGILRSGEHLHMPQGNLSRLFVLLPYFRLCKSTPIPLPFFPTLAPKPPCTVLKRRRAYPMHTLPGCSYPPYAPLPSLPSHVFHVRIMLRITEPPQKCLYRAAERRRAKNGGFTSSGLVLTEGLEIAGNASNFSLRPMRTRPKTAGADSCLRWQRITPNV